MLGYIRGRESKPASTRWILLKTVLQMVVFWGVFLFLLPWAVVSAEPAAWRSGGLPWVGAAVFAFGAVLGPASAAVMAVRGRGTPLPSDCARELVVAGPYRFVRNPMAVAGLAQGVAVGLFLGSPAVVGYAALGGPVWNLFVRPWEEADLERRFGDSYRRYKSAVRCWVPRFPGYRAD